MKQNTQRLFSLKFFVPLCIVLFWLIAMLILTWYQPFAGIVGQAAANKAVLLYPSQPEDSYSLALFALNLDPNIYEANVTAGFVLYDQNDFSGGIPYFEKSALIKSDNCQIRFGLGYGYEVTGEAAEAIKQYQIGEKKCPQDIDTLNTFLEAYSRLGYEEGATRIKQKISQFNLTIDPSTTNTPTNTLVPIATKTKVPTATSTHTPTPVPQSSILFEDNFSDGNADDWDPSDGTSWVVEKDESGNYFYEITGAENYPQTWPGEGDWSDYAFESRIRIKKGTVFVLVRANGSSFYNVSINTSDISLARWNVNISEYKVVKSVEYPIQLNKWYLVRVEIVGQHYKLFIDDKLVTSYTYENDSPVVKGGVGYYIGGGETVQIDDVRVWALTDSPTPIPTALPTEITDAKDAQMVLVPAGDFTMGINNPDPNIINVSSPSHNVYLDAFWIDKTEVTNKMYAMCVAAGNCTLPYTSQSETRKSYYGNPKYDNYPVVYMLWSNAKSYCEWAGKRLPTEAEWEKAARGTDGRIYPWGNTPINKNLANYAQEFRDTTPIGNFPSGSSPYGVLDMAGNAWEWVADWYDPDYYSNSPSSNPKGPFTGEQHILRGGGWSMFVEDVNLSYYREAVSEVPDGYILYSLGIRCARDANP